MLRIVWEFRVPPARRRRFEVAYGPRGAWARLFRRARGYRGTILLRDRDTPGRYVTVDTWDDVGSWRAFKKDRAEEYALLDRRCERLTSRERRLGVFDSRE